MRVEINCRSTYLGIDGSRLFGSSSALEKPNELRSTLRSFFRWNGAPWFKGQISSAEDTALDLHRAFLSTGVTRSYFAPLDGLSLEDWSVSPHQKVKNIRFGPNEIALLTSGELGQRIPNEGLKRFGGWCEFPIEKLDDRYWLIVTVHEDSGPIWERKRSRLFHMTWSAIGNVPVYEPTYPAPIEDALFILLLTLVSEPNEISWKPFAVPWVYSFTDDPFEDPQHAPDHSLLSWTLVGEPGEEFEASDHSEFFEVTHQLLEALHRRWCKLETALEKTDPETANFHPLTKHFFVKALSEEGIDEIIANISCIEATLQLPTERNRTKLMKRYKHLVDNDEAYDWLNKAFKYRKNYLHSLGCQRRSKISPPGRSKTSPLDVMRYAVLGGCPGSP